MRGRAEKRQVLPLVGSAIKYGKAACKTNHLGSFKDVLVAFNEGKEVSF